MCYRSVASWGGHLARMPAYRKHSLAYDVMTWRDRVSLDAAMQRLGTQGHPSRFRVWRWEKRLADFFGHNWIERAQDKSEWSNGIDQYVCGLHDFYEFKKSAKRARDNA